MECNFPELLACDLEASVAVFASKRMTAGSPLPGLASPDIADSRHQSLRGDLSRPASASPYQDPPSNSLSHGVEADIDAAEDYPAGIPLRAGSALSRRSVLSRKSALSRRSLAYREPEQEQEQHPRAETPASLAEVDEEDTSSSSEDEDDKENDDDNKSESSFEMPLPSVRCRQQSVATAATSVTSGRCSSAMSPVAASAAEGKHSSSGSWMDFERDSPRHYEALRTRAETPVLFHRQHDLLLQLQQEQRPSTSCGFPSRDKNNHRLSQISTVSLNVPVRKSSLSYRASLTTPEPISPSKRQNQHKQQQSGSSLAKAPATVAALATPSKSPSHRTHPSMNSSLSTANSAQGSLRLRIPHKAATAKVNSVDKNSEPGAHVLRDMDSDSEGDDDDSGGQGAPLRPESPESKDTFASPAQAWRDPSMDLSNYSHRPSKDGYTTPALPLPKEVLDTLKVSISCFPETMLVPSSFTIQTIRSYSRKIRRVGRNPTEGGGGGAVAAVLEAAPIIPAPYHTIASTSPTRQRRRWKLPWLSASRTTTPPPEAQQQRPQQQLRSSSARLPPSPTASNSDEQNDDPCSIPHHQLSEGARLKGIFPTGSNYLCDALYAHIVALNYISLLCNGNNIFAHNLSTPFTASLSTPAQRRQTIRVYVDQDVTLPLTPSTPSTVTSKDKKKRTKSEDEDSRQIPRKAATLLGISSGAGQANQEAYDGRNSVSPRKHRTQAPSVGGKANSLKAAAPIMATGDSSLREIQAGLAACAGRLVSTLKLTTGHMGDTPLSAEAVKDVDPLFMRALCELVRCCEEMN